MNVDELKRYVLSTRMDKCPVCGEVIPCSHWPEEKYAAYLKLNEVLKERWERVGVIVLEPVRDIWLLRNV